MIRINPRMRRRPYAAILWTILVLAVLALIALAAVAWSGGYDIGADAPHTRPVFWYLQTVRDRSIAAHARGVQPPADLMSEARVLKGAGLYAGMCTGCHLAPGMAPTEMAQGLYPQAPRLARGTDLSPAEEFWVIKHGVKLTAMPAWGKTHSDPLIWDMVAFLQRLPHLSPAQYKAIVASAPADHDEIMKDATGG